MPNIIINNYCNQACSYCFAYDNMKDTALQKNMKLSTFLVILKYLKRVGDDQVRILGGEPIMFPKLRQYIDIAERGGFEILIFSNINMNPEKFKKIFQGTKSVRINCNINDEDFYTEKEKENINKNLAFLVEEGINTSLGYNIINASTFPDFHIKLGKKHEIKSLNIKVTNSGLGGELFLDTNTKEFGDYIYECVKRYSEEFHIELSCGLSKSVFSEDQLDYIQNTANIYTPFGCQGHRGVFDINTDGSIRVCYAIESLYKDNKLYIQNLYRSNIPYESTVKHLYKGVYSDGECTAHKAIKGLISL